MTTFLLFLKLKNIIIKKSNIYDLYLLSPQLKLEFWQSQSILGLGEYRNLNDLATNTGIWIISCYPQVAFSFYFQNTNNML